MQLKFQQDKTKHKLGDSYTWQWGKLLRSGGPIAQINTNRIWPRTTDMQNHHLLQFLQTLKSNSIFLSTSYV